MTNETGYIYKITNKTNGKIYIGKTFQDPEVRFRQHYHTKSHSKLKKAILKEGFDNFTMELIYSSKDEVDINEKEMYFIDLFNSRDPDIGYNICKGGEGSKNHIVSKEWKEKMSIIMGCKVQNLNTGEVFKSLYDVDRQYLGKTTSGVNAAIKHNHKFKGCWWIKIKDSPLNEEERIQKIKELEEISEKQKIHGISLRAKELKLNPPLQRKVICIETQEIFNTMVEVNTKYHCDVARSIRRGDTAAGCHWAFVEDKDRISLLTPTYYNPNAYIGMDTPREFRKFIRCLETNEVLKSSKEFHDKYPNYNLGAVQSCARKESTSSYGLHWAYINKKDYYKENMIKDKINDNFQYLPN